MLPEDYDNQYNEPSRLLNNKISYRGGYISMAEYRSMVAARSLYNLDNEYENTNMFSLNNKSEVANSISTILNTIPQWNRLSANTNLITNAIDAFGSEKSPIARIGIEMLAKQMVLNSTSNLATRWLPSIDFGQALKGNVKGIFKRNVDNTITVKDSASKSGLEKIAGFAEKYLGVETYNVFGKNPFPDAGVSNKEYMQNTGEAQLTKLFKGINFNTYKPINTENLTYMYGLGEDIGEIVQSSSHSSLAAGKIYYTFDAKNSPYFKRSISINKELSIENANISMGKTLSSGATIQEYFPNRASMDDDNNRSVFGETKVLEPKPDIENFVGIESNFTKDTKETNLVWGRDGVGHNAATYVGNLRGKDDATNLNEETEAYDRALKPRVGLLEYTRNLLNATEGNFVDITRKAFKDGDRIVGFNGSPLWRGNDKAYSRDSGQANKAGVRQHSALDPYDRFAKLIRFNGNKVYEGSPQSVIHHSVLPRIHPTMNHGVLNRKNLMLSIENLAVGTIERETYGVIDDEFGTAIPLGEVGPFNGRMMWFPPYDLQVQEVALAKYESTVMVGRNEPMYNYMNSERTAVLNFTLLVDYPEQLRADTYKGEDKNKVIADFFAYGGDPLPNAYQVEEWRKMIIDLEIELEGLDGPVDQAEPPVVKKPKVVLHFQNNKPSGSTINSVVSEMYNNPQHYEILDSIQSATDGNSWGLNKNVYFLENLTGVTTGGGSFIYTGISGTSDQYTATGRTNQDGSPCVLNENLFDVYSNEDNRKYYNFKIEGDASKLYLNEGELAYNLALGERRIDAAEHLVRSRLAEMFTPEIAASIGIKREPSTGSVGQSSEGADPKNMHKKAVKEERTATISFVRNTKEVEPKEQNLNTEQEANKARILAEIRILELKIKRIKNTPADNILEERDKAILNGFEAVSGNKYYPTYHTQTPEDFHRRLTFLQQCVRQGAAKRYDVEEEDGILRAKNSVFGRQPICILRVGDFFYTKVVIDNVTIDYNDAPWDMNPEGFGMQPMMAKVTLQMKLIGGQSLKGPIDALQNAVSFNYYANSNFTEKGMYAEPARVASDQEAYINGVLTKKKSALNTAYENTANYKKVREGEK